MNGSPARTRDLRLLPAAAAGWLGCVAAVRVDLAVAGLVVVTALAVTGLAAWRLRRPPEGRHRAATPGRAAAAVALTGVVVAVLTGVAAVRAEVRRDAVEPWLHEGVPVTFVVESEPREAGEDQVVLDATWLDVAATSQPDSTRVGVAVTVLADRSWWDVVVGSRVRATVRVAGTEPGEASAALLVADGMPIVEARAPPLAALVAELRAGLLRACATLDGQAQGLVPGIALGDDRALPASLAQDMRAVSLTHVTAVSGAHVAMVLGLVLALLVRLPRPWRAGVGLLVLVALVVLVHPAPSVLRSAVMGGVLLIGLLLGRPRVALPALWTSVIGLLAADPWLATSFGFVLSVLATAGLLLGAAPLADRFARALPRPLALALAVPVAAQLACLPAIAVLQPAMPVYSVLANVLAAPAVPPVTVLGLAATLMSGWAPGAAEGLAGLAAVGTAWIASVATWCAALPWGSAPWPAVAALAAGLAVALRLRARRRSRAGGRGVPTDSGGAGPLAVTEIAGR